jgi:hypothetical protein
LSFRFDSQTSPVAPGMVHVFHDHLFEITFAKNGMSYLVQSLSKNATSTLDILKSWEFISATRPI